MITNIFPIDIPFENYNIQRVQSKEGLLNELRSNHNSTHSFFEIGDYIYVSNKDGYDLDLGDYVDVNVTYDSLVTSALIKHVFFRTFKERQPNVIPHHFYPFQIFSTKNNHDLIFDLVEDDLKGVLKYPKQITVQLRQIEVNGRNTFGFVFDVGHKWVFNSNCKSLVNEGFDLMDLEVLNSEGFGGYKDILAPEYSLIGYVEKVEDEKAVVRTVDGAKTYNLRELYLHKSKYNIYNYLSFRYGESKAEEILEKVKEKQGQFNEASFYAKEIARLRDFFCGSPDSLVQYQNKDGFLFTIDSKPLSNKNQFSLENPTFIYDPSGLRTENSYPDRGLNNYGPYNSASFPNKDIQILAICKKDNRGYFTSFLDSLLNGIPKSKYFKKGFKEKYHLHSVDFSLIEIEALNYDSYYDGITTVQGAKPHLALVEIDSYFKKLSIPENPYYRIKAELLNREIPVQFVTSQKIKRYDEYILNTMALQVYAKLGGTPWVLAATKSVDHELIIGVGHSVMRNEKFKGGDKNRVVGITTFFSSDGQYLLSNRSKDVSYSDYFDELLKNLTNSISELSSANAWKNGDTVRLVFHIFKPIKNVEFDVVSDIVRSFNQYNIKFAFVTIGKNHPFYLLNTNRRTNGGLDANVAFRGANIILDSRTCLLQMLGPGQIKSKRHHFSRPIQIRLRTPTGNAEIEDIESLLFTDLNYIVQQIYYFSNLSWRSFMPAESPVTMLYSRLISELLGRLRLVDGWKPDMVNYELKSKKWFL